MTQKVVSSTKKTPPKSKQRIVPEEYGIHLGQIIREQVAASKVRQTELAKELGITTIGMQHKLNSPTYGTIYDIIKTSKIIDVDLFHIMRMMLVKRGLTVFQGNEEKAMALVAETQAHSELVEKENELLKKLVEVRGKMKK